MPEFVVFVAGELVLFDQSLEWLNHELFAIFDIVEYFIPEDKESAIYPNIRIPYIVYFFYKITVSQGDNRKTL